MPTPSRSGDVKRSSASALVRRVWDATFSPTARRAGSEILPRSRAIPVVIASAVEAPDGEGGVVTTEAKAVAEHRVDRSLDADVGGVVEVELGIRILVVDRRRDDSGADDHGADDSLDGAGGAEHVAGGGLG